MTLRLAFVTDIHFGPDIGAKKGSQALTLIDKFVDQATAFRAHYILTGGDDISSHNPETDEINRKSVAQAFSRAASTVLKAKGNHCGRFEKDKSPSEIIDTGDHQIIIWNPCLNNYSAEGVVPDPEDIIWLETSLTAAAKPVILLSHVPFGGPESARRKWKQENKIPVYYPSHFVGEDALQDLVENSEKVIMCLSGHRHLNDIYEQNGVHYIIHQSLVEIVENDQPAGAFSMIEINDTEIHIHGHGLKQPEKTVLPILSKPAKLKAA